MICALIFDKDGTLTDFNATWGTGARDIFSALVGDDIERKRAMGAAIGFDYDSGTFAPGCIGVTGPETAVIELLAPHVPELSKDALEVTYFGAAREVKQKPVLELAPYFAGLKRAGYALGVVTNDAEAPAVKHMNDYRVFEYLDFLAGFDSGYGAKPDPGPLTAFSNATGVAPAQTVMVGDSHYDLIAARDAGMRAVGVLTGAAQRADLESLAETVLPDISYLPAWLSLD